MFDSDVRLCGLTVRFDYEVSQGIVGSCTVLVLDQYRMKEFTNTRTQHH